MTVQEYKRYFSVFRDLGHVLHKTIIAKVFPYSNERYTKTVHNHYCKGRKNLNKRHIKAAGVKERNCVSTRKKKNIYPLTFIFNLGLSHFLILPEDVLSYFSNKDTFVCFTNLDNV